MDHALVTLYWLAVLPGTVPANAVRIETQVAGRRYTWHVTNVSAPPIHAFSIPAHLSYDFRVPDGWIFEKKHGVLEASSDRPGSSIGRGETKRFSITVHARGAVVGHVRAKMGFRTEPPLFIDHVWAPVRERRPQIALVAAIVTVLGVFHVLRSRRHRRQTT